MQYCLPPKLNTLSSFIFGKMIIKISKLQIIPEYANSKIKICFLGEDQSQVTTQFNKIQYNIYCSLWHFHTYLKDIENIRFQILDKNLIKRAEALLYLPVYIYKELDVNSHNVMSPLNNNFSIYKINDHMNFKPIGTLQIQITTQFNNQYTNIAKNYITDQLIKSQQSNQNNTDLKLQLQKQYQMLQNSNTNTLYPQQFQNRPNFLSLHSQSKDEFVFDQEYQTKKLQQQIDRMVADLQAKEYDSSKYQDDKNEKMNQILIDKFNDQKKIGIKIEPNFLIKQYSLNKQLNSRDSQVTTIAPTRRMDLQQNIPFGYNKKQQINEEVYTKKQIKCQGKTLKIQIFELSITVAKQNIYQQFCDSKLIIEFPNTQKIQFIGKINGQTIKYAGQYQIQVSDTYQANSKVHKYFNVSDSPQYINFYIFDRFSTTQLAFGKFDLDRLSKVQGKGVFIVSLNNRKIIGNQRIKIAPNKLSQIKPNNISLYNLRVNIELFSDIKNKLYQFFLNLQNINIDEYNNKVPLEIKYKLYGSNQKIEISTKNGESCNHSMVIPILLQNLLNDKNARTILQVWGKSLIGLVDLQFSKIGKVLIRQKNGKMNENILNANLYPLYLYNGDEYIKDLVYKKKKGSIRVTLCFGNIKQINKVMQENGKNKLRQQQVYQNKKISLPYDDKLGIFIKQRKNVKEIDIQVYETQLQNCNIKTQPIQQILFQRQIPSFSESSIQQIRQIKMIPQKIQPQKKLFPKIEPKISITKLYSQQIQKLINSILQINPNFINQLKTYIKPYLLFNFIQIHHLTQALEKLKLNQHTSNQIINLLTHQDDKKMISMTSLYDYFSSIKISGCITENLLNQSQLGDFIIDKYIEKIQQDVMNQFFISQMDEIKQKMIKLGYFLNLRQIQIFWRRFNNDLKINTLQKWMNFYSKIKFIKFQKQIAELQKQKAVKQVLQQIYQEVHFKTESQKSNYISITLKGYDSCIQSAKCLLDLTFRQSYIKFRLQTDHMHQVIFSQDQTLSISLSQNFRRQDFEILTGYLQLWIEGKLISKGCINLQNLSVDQISSTYGLKTNQNRFCGLVQMTILYIE